MKQFILALVAALSLCAMAADDTPQKKPRRLTPEIKAKLMARSGGTVVKRAQGPEFAFVNCQSLVKTDVLKKVPEELEKILNFPFAMREGEIKECPLAEAPGMINFKTAAVVLIVDDPKLPAMSLVAPEGKWAVINVNYLNQDKPDAEKLAARVRKLMWRDFALVAGAANTMRYGCLMKTVDSVPELDALPYETVSPDPFPAICRTLTKWGVGRNLSATYRRAYLEGWAPPPETDMQRQIVKEEEERKAKNAEESK